jgi:hypothetical protein
MSQGLWAGMTGQVRWNFAMSKVQAWVPGGAHAICFKSIQCHEVRFQTRRESRGEEVEK